MTDEKKPLKCTSCGTLADGDMALIAKVGGTHYQERQHSVGTFRKSNKVLRTCGKWAEQETAK